MKLYRMITGPDDAQFCMRVSKLLNHGWELYGSPTLIVQEGSVIVGQAVVKEVFGEEFTDDTVLSEH
ncbi:DUF1737 domain-containing protein [Vibrio sonorensis]|uniref:DUF1737 domain-containing protein n=1 Tax=Vibrio sonorensis TaxID=1004316 RepID=UPI0008DAF34B|nr:DUF1737 domain-containing protein [Vibrio sonorensis]